MSLHPVRLLHSFISGSVVVKASADTGRGAAAGMGPNTKITDLVTTVTTTGNTSPQEKPSPSPAGRAQEGGATDLTASHQPHLPA